MNFIEWKFACFDSKLTEIIVDDQITNNSAFQTMVWRPIGAWTHDDLT